MKAPAWALVSPWGDGCSAELAKALDLARVATLRHRAMRGVNDLADTVGAQSVMCVAKVLVEVSKEDRDIHRRLGDDQVVVTLRDEAKARQQAQQARQSQPAAGGGGIDAQQGRGAPHSVGASASTFHAASGTFGNSGVD